MSGRLILCATPIGNLEDVTQRSLRLLAEADVVACEDTRRTRKLLSHHGVQTRRLVVYNEGNERRRAPALVQKMLAGDTVLLVSDAGMPGLSDPGYRLVRAAVDAGVVVAVAPGPTAAISALAISGLPPARFVFEGFLPRKAGDRRRRLEELRDEERTLVFYESPHRVLDCLDDLYELFGDRPAAVVRELTKVHEEVRRGSLEQLRDKAREVPPRGEIVLVVGGALRRDRIADPEELAAAARALMSEGLQRKAALQQVAREAGVPKRAVFDALVEPEEPEV
ncbi:MAG: 16S rRNA (cytidine(1402)-2'-O)-methyltransferase [Actinomycetota bacterium]|nr:16S rRNA (cytidine(1402)-2'-O)-methyltransferase [Actinomycetota bacterium]